MDKRTVHAACADGCRHALCQHPDHGPCALLPVTPTAVTTEERRTWAFEARPRALNRTAEGELSRRVLRLLSALDAAEAKAEARRVQLGEHATIWQTEVSGLEEEIAALRAKAERLQSRIWTMTAEAEDHASDLLALREVAQITADEREAMRRQRDEALHALDAMEVALGLPEACTRAEALHVARSLRSDRNEARAEIEALQAEITRHDLESR